MLFSSSSFPFSVTMERIEKCAADRGLFNEDAALNALRMKISGAAKPDVQSIRQELADFADSIITSVVTDDFWAFENLLSYETLYAKLCLELFKLEDFSIGNQDLALPFMVVDFFRLAADRFSNGKVDELHKAETSFEDALEFFCGLNMPAVLKETLAGYAAKTVIMNSSMPLPRVVFEAKVNTRKSRFVSFLNDSVSVWRSKSDRLCCLCLKELHEMCDFMSVFWNVSRPDVSGYVPKVLDAPYTLEKLYRNLIPAECHFHDDFIPDMDYVSEDDLLLIFANNLRRLSEIKQDDPYKAIKISVVLKEFGRFEEDVLVIDAPKDDDEFISFRDEFEHLYPWCKPYFLWRDAVAAGVEQDDCILPEALKGSRDCTDSYNMLKAEWDDLRKDLEPQSLPSDDLSLAELQEYFLKREQAFKGFLRKRVGNWMAFFVADDASLQWIADTLANVHNFALIFKTGLPEADAPVEKIGDYFRHTFFIKKVCNSTLPRTFQEVLILEYLKSLSSRVRDEMANIAGENTPVYLRNLLLERFNTLCQKISFLDDQIAVDAARILAEFRKKYHLSENGSLFSDDIRRIRKIREAEEIRHRAELAEAAAAERRKVLFEMSHSIKNLLASVSEPLSALQDELSGTQRKTVEKALSGAGLIRDLAVGVHMSMRGEPGTWRKDVLEPGFGAETLDKIILDAVRHAVSNMFDGKYFAQFVKNYFGGDLNTFMQAQNEWKAAVSAEDTFACINKYFFDFTLDPHGAGLNIPVGDRDGTAAKLLILFQELFLNAVKYSSFTERGKRFVKLEADITPETWIFTLSNSAAGRSSIKSSGIGLSVIKNFAELFEAEYGAGFKEDNYISKLKFLLKK